MLVSLAASATTPLSAIQAETADMAPQLVAIGAAGIAVGAVVLIFKRGWGFFKGVSR